MDAEIPKHMLLAHNSSIYGYSKKNGSVESTPSAKKPKLDESEQEAEEEEVDEIDYFCKNLNFNKVE